MKLFCLKMNLVCQMVAWLYLIYCDLKIDGDRHFYASAHFRRLEALCFWVVDTNLINTTTLEHMTKYRQNYSMRSITPFKCIRWQLFANGKGLTRAVSSISENFRVKGQGHHKNKYMYVQKGTIGATTPFEYTRWELLSIKKTFGGNVWPTHIDSACRGRHPNDALELNLVGI